MCYIGFFTDRVCADLRKYRYNEENPSVYTDDSFTELFQFWKLLKDGVDICDSYRISIRLRIKPYLYRAFFEGSWTMGR